MRGPLAWLPPVVRSFERSTGIVIDDGGSWFDIGFGFEAWIHEHAHFVLLRGGLTIKNPTDKDHWVGSQIDDVKAKKGKRAGRDWGVDHELKTLAVELFVAEAIELEIDPCELALYALENGNLRPRWSDSEKKAPGRIKEVVQAIREAQGSSEVLEAAAYLSRAIWAEKRRIG